MIASMAIAALIAFGLMLITWLFYLRTQNPGVVDVSWGLGILLCGQWYLSNEHLTSRVMVISILLLIWGVRLSGFLWYTRVRPNHIEKRYLDIAKGWQVKKSIGFLANFMLQAFLLFFIALPLLFISKETAFAPIDIFAAMIVLVGIAGETVADFQLYRFKKNGNSSVCDKGLWQYSRHPNYFFEIVTWLGFSLFALREAYGFYALISPVLLIIIMRFITGPITERVSLQSKGDAFKTYQETTSMIIPLPPKRK